MHTLGDRVTLNGGVRASQTALRRGALPGWGAGAEDLAIAIAVGSVQSLALRPLPLVQLHFTGTFTLDGDTELSFTADGVDETYMLGGTWTF